MIQKAISIGEVKTEFLQDSLCDTCWMLLLMFVRDILKKHREKCKAKEGKLDVIE